MHEFVQSNECELSDMKTLQELQDALDDDFLDPDMPEKLVEEELRECDKTGL